MSDLRSKVFANLDSAKEGGQFEHGGYLYRANAQDIAEDLTIHAADLDEEREEDLLPHVREWLSNNGMQW
jgi:hypothetical protein